MKNYEEALATANDTEFSLSASIATTSLKHATHFKAPLAGRHGDGQPADSRCRLPRPVRWPQRIELRLAASRAKYAAEFFTEGEDGVPGTRDKPVGDVPWRCATASFSANPSAAGSPPLITQIPARPVCRAAQG